MCYDKIYLFALHGKTQNFMTQHFKRYNILPFDPTLLQTQFSRSISLILYPSKLLQLLRSYQKIDHIFEIWCNRNICMLLFRNVLFSSKAQRYSYFFSIPSLRIRIMPQAFFIRANIAFILVNQIKITFPADINKPVRFLLNLF